MTVLLKMPLHVYLNFIDRCSCRSREYTLLESAIVALGQDGSTLTAEVLCSAADARMLRQQAELFCPDALPYTRHTLPGEEGSSLTFEYRREAASQTWHFCSNCSHWPIGFEYIVSRNLPDGSEICNECTVKSQHGECR
jgi:hypothetical protein